VFGDNILQATDACILNQGEATHEHLQTGSSTCIDLCLLSSTILPDYEWCRMNDLCGSDHYPIMVKPIAMNGNGAQQRLLLDKADWNLFRLLTDGNYDEMKMLAVDDMVQAFTNVIMSAAEQSIPRSSGVVRPRAVPWWNQACKNSHQTRKAALRRYQRTKSPFDKAELNRATQDHHPFLLTVTYIRIRRSLVTY